MARKHAQDKNEERRCGQAYARAPLGKGVRGGMWAARVKARKWGGGKFFPIAAASQRRQKGQGVVVVVVAVTERVKQSVGQTGLGRRLRVGGCQERRGGVKKRRRAEGE